MEIDWKKWLLYGLPVVAVLVIGYFIFMGNAAAPLTEVEGTVMLNGKPLANVMVEFRPTVDPGSRRLPFSKGATDNQGRFKLFCENKRYGAVLGTHKVVIRYPVRERNPDDGTPVLPPGPQVPKVYQSVAETPLEVEVTSEQREYPLTLTPAAP